MAEQLRAAAEGRDVTASPATAVDEPEKAVGRRLRVLTLARSFPSGVFPELGLWTERPTQRISESCDVQVISPVPYCPPLPQRGPLRQYARFRQVHRDESRGEVRVRRPRFFVGPGSSLYRFEARAYALGIRRTAERIHADTPIDLIHAHFIYPDGVAGHELAQRWNIPLVITEHAPWTGWLDRPGVRGPALMAARDAARLIAVSSYVRDSIVAYTGDPDRVVVIPNGVDPTMYRLGHAEARNPGQILYVGVINFNKGIDILLESMRGVLRERPDARLVLAGGSFYRNTRLQQEALERQAADLGLGDRVRFIGHRTPTEIARLMAESVVVVLPSRAESFGSVLIEALACGTPVVSSRSGGPEDIVDESVGKLVPKEDPAALARALVEVLDTPERYDPESTRRRVLERFGWESIVARTLEVYRDVVTP